MDGTSTKPVLTKAPAYRWWILVMNLLIYSVFYISLNAAAAFTVQIQDQWHTNATMINMLTTVAQLVYVIFCTIGAAMATKIGNKQTVVVAGILLMSSVVVSTVPLWFPIKQRGLASGILFGCIGFGFSITVAGGNLFLGLGFNWQASLALLVCIPGAIITALYWFTVKSVSDVYPGYYAIADLMPALAAESSDAPVTVDKNLPTTMKEARKDKKVLSLSLIGFACSWLILGFGAFLPFLLTNDLGVESSFATAIMSLTFLAGVVGSIFGGVISDTIFKGSRWQTLVISGLLAAVGLLCLLFVHGDMLVVVMLMLAYCGANLYMGPLWACVPNIVQPQIAGETTAFANTITNIGGLAAAPVLAMAIDITGTAMPALIICVVLALASCVAARVVHVQDGGSVGEADSRAFAPQSFPARELLGRVASTTQRI